MPTQVLRQLIITAHDAYEQGLRGFFEDYYHDDIEWTMHCPPEALPFPNRIRGKAAVLGALKRIDDVVETVRSEILSLVVDGENAALICDRTLRQRATGRIMRYKMAGFHRFKDGQMIEYQGFADGIDILQQTLGREVDIPLAYPDPRPKPELDLVVVNPGFR